MPEDDALLNEIEAALNTTGVVRGEFGFVEAYRAKQVEIKNWLADTRIKVKNFATRYISRLDQQIAFEQRTSEEDLERRKREYDEIDSASDQQEK